MNKVFLLMLEIKHEKDEFVAAFDNITKAQRAKIKTWDKILSESGDYGKIPKPYIKEIEVL